MTNLREYREKRNLRLRELGEMLGITAQSVRQQEVNGIRSIRMAERYAEVLQCSPLELLEFSTSTIKKTKVHS